jgi:uncharacterized protein
MSFTHASPTYKSASELNTAMAGVYFHMSCAVIVSMVVAMLVASTPAAMAFLFTGFMKWVVIFAPLVAIFAVTPLIHSSPSRPLALVALHGFAALMGLSLSAVLAAFTTLSIVSAFLGAAVLFGTMSIYGYFTKTNLDSIGKWLFVALIAIIITSIINLFIGSTALQMLLSAVAIVVFMGLTAYDVQNIRNNLSEGSEYNPVEVLGALSLYLNFINIFTSLLNLFGERD